MPSSSRKGPDDERTLTRSLVEDRFGEKEMEWEKRSPLGFSERLELGPKL